MKHSFFRIPVLFINFADDNRNGSHVSLFTLLMEREFFNYPNRFILQCDNGEWWGLYHAFGMIAPHTPVSSRMRCISLS